MAKQKARVHGAQVLRNEAYTLYAAVTKDTAQRRRWGVPTPPLTFLHKSNQF